MDNKKSFIGYCDWLPIFMNLKNNEAGKLIKHLLEYVNDLNPEPPNRIIKLVFEPIKQQLKRDLKKWETVQGKRIKAGQASAAKRQNEGTKSTCVDISQQMNTVNDNVNVSDNANEIVREDIPTLLKSNDLIISIENLEDFMLSDEKWIETLSTQNHITKENTIIWIKNYVSKLKAENEKSKSRKDCFAHCARWINYEKNEKNKHGFSKPSTYANNTSIFSGES